jgi:hypothetical protein
MVLTKEELLSGLHHETHILVHLAGKADPSMHDYRPTPSQRSMLELLQYRRLLAGWTDDFLRAEIDMFGNRFTRGKMLVIWSTTRTPRIARSSSVI